MEEDIKILENMLNKESLIYKTNKRGNKEIRFEVNSNYYKAMKNLIKAYKELEEENKNLKLKERNRAVGKYGEIEVHDLINKTLANDYIPISLVEEKIEELEKEYKQELEKNSIRAFILKCQIEILQKLLEKRK